MPPPGVNKGHKTVLGSIYQASQPELDFFKIVPSPPNLENFSINLVPNCKQGQNDGDPIKGQLNGVTDVQCYQRQTSSLAPTQHATTTTPSSPSVEKSQHDYTNAVNPEEFITSAIHNGYLKLLRQMADVAELADKTFSHLAVDIDAGMARSKNLSARVANLFSVIQKADPKKIKGKNGINTGSDSSCKRTTPSKVEISGPYNLFTASTRPSQLVAVYDSLSNRRKVSKEDCACQTDNVVPQPFCSTPKQQKLTKCVQKSPYPSSTSSGDGIYESIELVRVDTSGLTLKRLSSQRRSFTTPKQAGPSKSVTGSGCSDKAIKVDAQDRDVMICERARQRRVQKRVTRRNTIGGSTPHDIIAASTAVNQEKPKKAKSTSRAGSIGDRLYDDFCGPEPMNAGSDQKSINKHKFLATLRHQFATLKHFRKKDKTSSENVYENLRDSGFISRRTGRSSHNSPGDESDSSSGYRASNSATQSSRSSPVGDDLVENSANDGTLKKVFRRTFSLRLPKRSSDQKSDKTGVNLDDLYSTIQFRRKPIKLPPSDNPIFAGSRRLPPPIPPKKRSDLPISTVDSQVMQVAAGLREMRNSPVAPVRMAKLPLLTLQQPSCQILRPPSMVSLGSDWSINMKRSGKRSQSSYRQGYRLEYPTECQTSPSITLASVSARSSSESPSAIKNASLTQFFPPCDSENSVGGDSNFSCDLEGYFTSMHKDSGLWDYKRIDEAIFESGTLRKSDVKREKSSRGQSFSTHSSTSTIAGTSIDRDTTQDLISFSELDSDLPDLPKTMIHPHPEFAYPPLCDISNGSRISDPDEFPADSEPMEQQDNSEQCLPKIPPSLPLLDSPRWRTTADRKGHQYISLSARSAPENYLPIAKVRPHQHNGKMVTVGTEEIPEALFDSWLFAKFRNECKKSSDPDQIDNQIAAFSTFSLPRSTYPSEKTSMPDVNGNCSFELIQTLNSYTLPRKAVRFCDA